MKLKHVPQAGSTSAASLPKVLAKSVDVKPCLWLPLQAHLPRIHRQMPLAKCAKSWPSNVICAQGTTTRPVSRPAQPVRLFASSPHNSSARPRIFCASASCRIKSRLRRTRLVDGVVFLRAQPAKKPHHQPERGPRVGQSE